MNAPAHDSASGSQASANAPIGQPAPTPDSIPASSSSPRGWTALLESSDPNRPTSDYRRLVREHYDGLPGALTRITGLITGHEALAGHLISPGGFDVRGAKHILDAGCGNGRYSHFLLRQSDADALLTAFDYSRQMLARARERHRHSPGGNRITHCSADLTRLPYPDAFFDAAVCGWVIEHLPDPTPGLRELARVLRPGGKLLLMATENTFTGAVCSRLWHCRTYDRLTLRAQCAAAGLHWLNDLWFTPLHRRLKLGGIITILGR